ncbi:ImmA/IrrE family metallo-endopeptidase [Cytobacillus horneckiae]|uniref:ImmA/IrrE family metallo-endopeptidase n=1 Tax=Cytobacillus horneckiae TaxID=549687 RepID=UPI0019D21143|nr:ImmA/IrrE family metallo-endopeptidase [Cytobacillus horneckiae]MBN6889941.1 ImmA/IrrE family metallo-endopeptidase [Cytobacillus horneckiae]
MNVQVIEWNYPKEVFGVYKYHKRSKYILINSNLPSKTKKFVCGHELGHSTSHPRLNTMFLKSKTLYSKDKLEREANEFSLSLLLHGCVFSEYKDIEHLCFDHGIPHELSYLIKKFY